METVSVTFEFITGIARELFTGAQLKGSWTEDGRHGDVWRSIPMTPFRAPCGSAAFRVEVPLAKDDVGKSFAWGVILDAPGRPGLWGIPTETGEMGSPAFTRTFTLDSAGSVERYRLSPQRNLGANKYWREGDDTPGIRFSVWAPNAQNVELAVAADTGGGYIYPDGRGMAQTYAMARDRDGIWATDPADPAFENFSAWPGKRYMFKITRDDGSVAFRTDICSRSQAGTGGKDPEHEDWNGREDDLDCTKSCSVVKDPDMVGPGAAQENGSGEPEDPDEFWKHEFDPLRPLPTSVEDMVIYEMHVAGLGAGREGPGTLGDAMGMLDYLVDLGVNVVELLPMSAFDGAAGWGYGTSHFYAMKYDPVGRDEFKHFVRACHRRGIAVIVDVVYNHYTPASERVQWLYDTARHDRNMYYYYHGAQEDYPDFPDGGYCDNYSTGYLPNMADERVRSIMIGSAVAMAVEFHVDGFRMDLTQALHSFNVLHFDGRPMPEANEAGIRFMREWVRTLRLFKPRLMLLAEDHSDWNMLARAQRVGGIGFDAVWWSDWYHQLIGDATQDNAKARLLHNAGFGGNKPLKMDTMAGMMLGSPRRVVYHESHDESGNSEHSARNIEVATNGMLFDNTRPWAEARCRVVTGLTLLSAGTPMFFMGEEVCAQKPYRHADFLENREDFLAMRNEMGAAMFRYYQDLIRLRLGNSAFRSAFLDIVKIHNRNRVLGFRRWLGDDEFLIVASLHNNAYANGYTFGHRNLKGKTWGEVFSSDRKEYGGSGMTNDTILSSEGGNITVRLPANSIVVFARMN